MIEMAMCFLFVSSFVEVDIKKHCVGIVTTILIYIFFNYITMQIAVYSICRLLVYMVIAFFAQFLFYRKYYDRIIVMTISYMLFFTLIDYSTVAVMSYLSGMELKYFQETALFRICGTVTSKVLLLVSVLFIRRNVTGLKKLQRCHLFFILGISGTILLFAFCIFDNSMHRNHIFVSETMMFILLWMIEVLSIYSLAAMAEKNEKEEKLQLLYLYNQMLQNSLDEEKNNFDLWSGRVHDYKNRMLYMLELLKTEEYEQLEKYIQEETGILKNQSVYIQSGYKGIDIVINSKIMYAQSQHIHLFCNINLPSDLLLDERAMITILGNLLDNAIQAESIMDKKYIEVNITYMKENICIKIVNHKEDGEINFKTSSKENAKWHGIGLRSVRQQIKKLHGDFKLMQDEDKVISMVVLYGIPHKLNKENVNSDKL